MKAYFGFLPDAIKQLETKGALLSESLALVKKVEEAVKLIKTPDAEIYYNKLIDILARNPRLDTVKKINFILNGDRNQAISDSDIDTKPSLYCKYKYAPITSCDVERSFSAYKIILTDKRHSLSTDNLEKIMMIYCELNYNQ